MSTEACSIARHEHAPRQHSSRRSLCTLSSPGTRWPRLSSFSPCVTSSAIRQLLPAAAPAVPSGAAPSATAEMGGGGAGAAGARRGAAAGGSARRRAARGGVRAFGSGGTIPHAVLAFGSACATTTPLRARAYPPGAFQCGDLAPPLPRPHRRAAAGGAARAQMSNKKILFILLLALDKRPLSCYIIYMKAKQIKARVNAEGLMNSASREHKVKKGKGSFKRRKKHQKDFR